MCKALGLYQRLSRHRAREAAAEELVIAEYDRKNNSDNKNMETALKTPLAGPPSHATMLEAAIDTLPEWCDRNITRKSVTRCAQKNFTQAHLSRLTGQVEKRYYDGQYCAGYKAATLAIQSAAKYKFLLEGRILQLPYCVRWGWLFCRLSARMLC